MSFYERIDKKNVKIPDSFDLTIGQIYDIKEKASGIFDAMRICFVFGYMQGVRAERTGKAGIFHE